MNKNTKRGIALCLALLGVCCLAGCKKGTTPPRIPQGGFPGGDIPGMNGQIPEDGQMPEISYSKVEEVVIDLPNEAVSTGARIEGATLIEFDDASASVTPENAGVTVEKGIVTVTKAGSYLLRGAFEGQLRVNTEDEEEVTLYLDGLQIVSPDSAALYVLSAPKRVTISTLSGSKNILNDGKSYLLAEGSDEPSAALFSKEDLTLEGEGSLYVSSKSAKGIYSKDDLKIKSGSIFVTSGDDGIRGKDSLTVTGGQITLSSGTDGLKTSNDSEEGKGTLLISGGKITLSAGDDGIDAIGKITLSGGEIAILTGEGASSNTSGGGKDFGGGGGGGGGFGGGGRPPRFENASASSSGLELTPLAATAAGGKGIKSDDAILILGSTLTVDAYDDALHATNSVEISGGTLSLAAGDDGIHADKALLISGGVITVSHSYEGIEGQYITLSGGKTYVTSTDDGFNATAGSSSGGMGGGMMGSGQDCSLTFEKECYVVVNASGDGLDSNGNAYQTGGTVIAFGPTNGGNGTVDTGDGRENGYFFSGGNLLAVGSSGMAESVDTDLPCLFANVSTLQAGTDLYILDGEGRCVVACTLPKSITNIVFASSSCQNSDFTVYSGGRMPALTDGVAFFPESTPEGGSKVSLQAGGGNGGGGGFRPW